MRDENMYENIVRKLGFEPKDYAPKYSHTENDQNESPFARLTLEELKFLQDHNYFQEE